MCYADGGAGVALQRSPNILPSPTSSVEHLRENLEAAHCNFLRK